MVSAISADLFISFRECGPTDLKGNPNVSNEKNRVCPVEIAGTLDNRIRKWLQNPRKILSPYIKKGMTVLDLGCGPGFFSIELARLVGQSGWVIASDLQEGMLQKIKNKIQGTDFENRIILHKCEADKIGVEQAVDFVLAFYMVHEVSDMERFLYEIESILKPDGRLFIAEPPFHVSKTKFEEMIQNIQNIGLTPVERPKTLFSRSVIFKKALSRS